MGKLTRGYIQVYTGNGKGKTTAAVGLGVRAAGDGYNVFLVQFLKSGFTGELESIKKLEPDFRIFRFEKKRGFFWTLNDSEKAELKKEIQAAYRFCLDALENNKCDVLIMDEIMGAISNELVSKEQVLQLIEAKPDNMELVLTGRNVPEEIVNKADLVTEMREIKHYFEKGVPAREGIEY
ncbi:Cob(I)yrinic acid a,c-diamide adenosyltransferase [Clostridium pasteurianum DSM 525 = ATCC 6013]|uniref:ATP:corrinoid adenosyltransferase BtuR/CobO/CobP n=1 Tax=Clostridium pasteurianum DSM 525 = ATCC 6013 TaxID=1262449 RepID=A0A0H3J3F8_CLOPA|nr:cob(I)yrinic acid a,c-diamide adenosyltransferase [Clostridium pasteurianum]AJA47357.1 Cob(I)yrinic acid a,c-diamide adenosyltransferase [Clostridium pasteurianum DSM 525 = ATCC 6013]AJA51345.1 Cob(I)yrinic acid a,c-diamide adenosyltransferase [Clostridium pasteurianum DSM 525 = ATCC 6013]AOZ74690.1 cob(I)yrinic acid a,c-diamide adenosyltransferase [Clostridium pasteurianum DSM 525 = ATCC 6013]AOZ78486.1 cob(I)yrinic acid a,c-diamide adenosyltransferase [Clostridium pasteurianum]ELP58695.1 